MWIMRLLILFLLVPLTLHSQSEYGSLSLDDKTVTQIQNEYSITNIEELLIDITTLLNSDYPDLRVVDKKNRLDEDYIPEDLINLSDYNLHTRYDTMLFSKRALEDFIELSDDARSQGIDIFIASTYRSWQFQNEIFNNMKNYHGEEKASTIVAYPGASQHQLGTGVDFGTIKPSYAYSEAGKWLKANGWKYGFSLSYPKGMEEKTTYMWEPWHYRYIGREAAIIERKYFQGLQHYFLEFWDRYHNDFVLPPKS